MLYEKDARHDSLRRIADALRIPVDDLYGTGKNARQYKQTDRMFNLWEQLETDKLREDALDAIRLIIAKNR
ncbi:hypothetical protein MKK69_17820 [Methylobacterium sp. J-026]|uniref:hypothetical protein n=1 Tax=Methylobacterium sp. J-026 TaxID=2836624 RepID=UPI001FBB9755|nr:hypothetical protein [Methylobacterium sp. J-026]MCJ2135887.1 hypothetical protein [Methylobacterium sp. J-026]